jgi:hypothetical protein
MPSVRKGSKTLFTMARSTGRQDVQKADLSEEGLGEADVGEASEEDARAMYLRTTSGQVRVITSTGWEEECPTCYFDPFRKTKPIPIFVEGRLKVALHYAKVFYYANVNGPLSCACCTLLQECISIFDSGNPDQPLSLYDGYRRSCPGPRAEIT